MRPLPLKILDPSPRWRQRGEEFQLAGRYERVALVSHLVSGSNPDIVRSRFRRKLRPFIRNDQLGPPIDRFRDDSWSRLPREVIRFKVCRIPAHVHHIAGRLWNGFPPNSSFTNEGHNPSPFLSITELLGFDSFLLLQLKIHSKANRGKLLLHVSAVHPTLLHAISQALIPALYQARGKLPGIQLRNTGFQVKPRTTNRAKGLLTHYIYVQTCQQAVDARYR